MKERFGVLDSQSTLDSQLLQWFVNLNSLFQPQCMEFYPFFLAHGYVTSKAYKMNKHLEYIHLSNIQGAFLPGHRKVL